MKTGLKRVHFILLTLVVLGVLAAIFYPQLRWIHRLYRIARLQHKLNVIGEAAGEFDSREQLPEVVDYFYELEGICSEISCPEWLALSLWEDRLNWETILATKRGDVAALDRISQDYDSLATAYELSGDESSARLARLSKISVDLEIIGQLLADE